jgi:hypothetical protein
VTVSPVAVVVAPIRLTIVLNLSRGLPRHLRLIWAISRCSILFHLLVPGVAGCPQSVAGLVQQALHEAGRNLMTLAAQLAGKGA